MYGPTHIKNNNNNNNKIRNEWIIFFLATP